MANGVFIGCSSLSSATIGNGLTAISDDMFQNCAKLSSVTIGTNVRSIGQKAFASCPELTDVYCYPQYAPSSGTDTFADSYIQFVTLHVPAYSISAYRQASPWNNFKEIVALDELPQTNKCATPTIAYKNGKLTFTSATEGVVCVWTLTSTSAVSGQGNTLYVPYLYELTVFATKEGWQDSDRVTAKLVWGDAKVEGDNIIRLGGNCDANGDGAVDIADIATIIDKMAGK